MEEFVELSRTVAADLAVEFRGNPRGELAAWLRIALEREGMVSSLYEQQSVKSRLQSLPEHLGAGAIAMINGIWANEERHVALLRTLLAGDFAWPQVVLKESWGRLQGVVLHQLAGATPLAQTIAPILLKLGARSARERAAATAVAGLDAGGFLKLSRTLEITAVESYKRVVTLLAALPRPEAASPSRLGLDLEMLGILRDERVHRDVFHVLHQAVGGNATARRRVHDAGATELPAAITTRWIASAADLTQVCRAILTFHYGAALPAGASPHEAMRVAVDYWRWQMEDPFRKSYFVERQRRDVFRVEGDLLLLGTAGLENVVRGMPFIRPCLLDQGAIPWFIAEGPSPLDRARSPRLKRSKPTLDKKTSGIPTHLGHARAEPAAKSGATKGRITQTRRGSAKPRTTSKTQPSCGD